MIFEPQFSMGVMSGEYGGRGATVAPCWANAWVTSVARCAASPGVLVVEYLSRHHRVLARGAATVGARATPLMDRWLPGMAPRWLAESEEEETERHANDEHEVCGVRLRHGSLVETRSTDEYPFSDGCEEPDLAGAHFGGAPRARTVGEENSDEEPASEAGSDGSA